MIKSIWVRLLLFVHCFHIKIFFIILLQGHYPWPDASKWTNKELGIPDDIPLDEEAA